MNLFWDRNTDWLIIDGGEKIAVSNSVRIRNRENPEEVVFTIPDRIPYMPERFPAGVWHVGKPLPRSNPYLAPYYIPTDAWQLVSEWTLEPDGSYGKPTGKKAYDSGYGIHFSTSPTTLGCLKVVNRSDLLRLAKLIAETDEDVVFEVV